MVDKVVPFDITSINIKLGVVDVNMVLVEEEVVATVDGRGFLVFP
jgi:hypothetical protein